MHAFLRQAFHHLQPEFSQVDSVACQFRVARNHTENISRRRVGVHSKKEIRRRQVEETQGMRLHDLRKMHQLPQFPGGRRYAYGHDGVAGLGRRE